MKRLALLLMISGCASQTGLPGWTEQKETQSKLVQTGSALARLCFASESDGTFAGTLSADGVSSVEVEGRFTDGGKSLTLQGISPLAEPLFRIRWNEKGAAFAEDPAAPPALTAFQADLARAGDEISAFFLRSALCGMHLFPESNSRVYLPPPPITLQLNPAPFPGVPPRYDVERTWEQKKRTFAGRTLVQFSAARGGGAIVKGNTAWRAVGLFWDSPLGSLEWEGRLAQGRLTPSRLLVTLNGRRWTLGVSDFAASPLE